MSEHQTQPGQTSGNPNGPATHPHVTVCGVVGLILGIIAIVLSFIPIINNAAAVLGFVGAVLAIIGIVGAFRGKRSGKAVSIVAAVLSVLAIVITLAMQQSASDAIDDALGNGTSQRSDNQSGNDQRNPDGQTSAGDAATSNVQDMEGDLTSGHVRIVSAARSGNDYEGKPTVLVTCEWTNSSDKNTSFAETFIENVFQNGHELEMAVYTDSPEGYDSDSYMAQLQPGATGTVTLGYVLEDESAVDVEISDLLSLDDNAPKVAHTFDL